MANEYITSTALKKTLSLTGETYADDDITAAISAASRIIEQECGRRFWIDSNDATRYYERIDSNLVVIDDLATLTSVKTDPDGTGTYSDIWTENTDYVFGPPNAVADGVPYTAIYRLAAGSYLLPTGPRRIQVIGKFGWAAVPAQVTEAATLIAARLLKRAREAPFSVIGFGIDGVAVRLPKLDPDVAVLLAGLKRGPIGSNGAGFV